MVVLYIYTLFTPHSLHNKLHCIYETPLKLLAVCGDRRDSPIIRARSITMETRKVWMKSLKAVKITKTKKVPHIIKLMLVYNVAAKSESESSASESESEAEETESSLSSENSQSFTASSKSTSKGSSPRKKSDNKSALKSRLIRKKKKAAIIYEKVPVENDLDFWAKPLQEFQSKITAKTEVSSSMFLKISNPSDKPVFQPKISNADKLRLEQVPVKHSTLAKSGTEVYSITADTIQSLAWVGENRVCVAINDRLLILPEGREANVTEWEDVERMSAHPLIHNLVVMVCGDEVVRVVSIEESHIAVLHTLPSYKCAPQVAIFMPDPQYLIVGYYDGIIYTWPAS